MDQFFERHNPPKLRQEEIDNFNRSVFIKEIASVIINFSNQKAPIPDRVISEFYQTLIRNYINALQSPPEDPSRGNTS